MMVQKEPIQVALMHSTGEIKKYWYFDRLPTFKELQKHSPSIVKMHRKIRPLLERKVISYLIDTEKMQESDYLHQRGSGLDIPTLKVCKENNVGILIDKNAFLAIDAIAQSTTLGRICQNVKLCNKFSVSICFVHKNAQVWQEDTDGMKMCLPS